MKSLLVVTLASLLASAGSEFPQDPLRARSAETLLTEALRSPRLATEVGLKAVTFTLEDVETRRLRVLIACQIDRSLSLDGTMALGYALTDANGAVVVTRFEPDVTSPVKSNGTQTYLGSATAEPGSYTLRVEVVDGAGRRGSVQQAFRAALTSAGPVRAGDLIIGDKAAGESGQNPNVAAEIAGDTLQGYLEVYGDAVEPLKAVTASIEVAATADGRALESSWLRFQDGPGRTGNRRVAEGTVLLAFLQPGPYVARAIISSGGRPIGQVTRPFRIVRAVANMPPGQAAASLTPDPAANTSPALMLDTRTAPEAAPSVASASRPDVFDKTSVLSPQVLSFVADKMNAGSRAGTTPPAALEAVRAGKFDTAVEATKTSVSNRLASTFITGLSLYAKGDLDNASKQFRETLRIDSEFFPAAFYLGAYYAAAGRDAEAAGAWQTSLVSLDDAPFIYTLMADAFLRLHQHDSALDILGEASQRWPESDAVKLRQGIALAASGKRSDALAVLDPYIARHPDDHAAILVALRTIYEARSTGKPIGTADEDRQRFGRYAAAYAAAQGPQQALVALWKKVVDK